MRAAALWVAALAGLVCVASSSKEFADCGSTSLTPLKLELDPDPAEVRHAPLPRRLPPPTAACRAGPPQASQPLEFIVTMEAEKMVTGGNVHATITSTRCASPPATAGAPGRLG